jgi:hypothetical protein
MSSNPILHKLLKIAQKQQKILTKLAQGDETSAKSFINSMTSSWLANNGVNARYRVDLVATSDPNQYSINLVMAPAIAGSKLDPNAPAKYKEYMTAKILEEPFLQSKVVKIDPKIVETL